MKNIQVVYPHSIDKIDNYALKIFLAGTDYFDNWQEYLINKFKANRDEIKYNSICFFNPRRNNETEEKKDFIFQYNWEIDASNLSQMIILNFPVDSKSLKLFFDLGRIVQLQDKGIIIICPPEFEHYQLVNETCKKFNIPLFSNIDIFFNRFFKKTKK